MAAPSPEMGGTSVGDAGGRRIDLRILSPGQGVPETIEVRDVPVSTTVAMLKERITRVSPSHPAVDGQRLIYQGHVLANASATLADVFGRDALREHRLFTIHLVVRLAQQPGQTTSLPPSQSTTRTPTPQPNIPGRVPQAGAAPPTGVIPPRPNELPFQRPNMMPQGIPGLGVPGFPPAFMPQPPQNFPAFAPNAGGMVPPHWLARAQQTNMQNPQIVQGQVQSGMPLQFNHLQRVAGDQAQPNAADPTNGHGLNVPVTEVQGGQAHGETGQENVSTDARPNTPAASGQQPQAGQGRPQGAGQNGLRYHMTVNQTTFAIPGAQGVVAGVPSPIPNFGLPQNGQFGPQQAFAMPHQAAAQMHQLALQQHHQQHQQLHQQRLAQMQRNVATPPNASSASASAATSTVPASTINQRTQQAPSTTEHTLQPQNLPSSTGHSFDQSAPTVYLLSSPAGPHALLFHPQGIYNTQMPQTGLLTVGDRIASHDMGSRRSTPSPFRATPTLPGTDDVQQQQDPPAQQAPAQLAQINGQDPAQPGVAAQGNAHGENDVLAPVQPLLAPFWLLFRILLFAYFFVGSGQGWRRPLALVGISMVFFIIRAVDAGHGARNAVRGWWEGVMGLPARPPAADNNAAAPPAPAQEAPQLGQAGPPQAGNAAQGNTAPTATVPGQQQQAQAAPQQEQQALGPWRARVRPLERALALFIASLWPGVGERTVRARREEDERRQRERDEAQRAIEQAQQPPTDSAAEDGAASSTEPSPVDEHAAGSSGIEGTKAEASASGAEAAPGGEVRERRRGAVNDGSEGSGVAAEGNVGEGSSSVGAPGSATEGEKAHSA